MCEHSTILEETIGCQKTDPTITLVSQFQAGRISGYEAATAAIQTQPTFFLDAQFCRDFSPRSLMETAVGVRRVLHVVQEFIFLHTTDEFGVVHSVKIRKQNENDPARGADSGNLGHAAE